MDINPETPNNLDTPEKSPETKTFVEAAKALFLGKHPETHQDSKEHHLDNVEFLNALEKMPIDEKQKLLEKSREWEAGGDLDLLRAAGLSFSDIKKNPLDRNIRLAAMYLKRDKSNTGLGFKVDFQNNQQAEFDLNLADLLPANILKVNIRDQDGKTIFTNATRSFKNGRPCYFTEKPSEEAFVKTGFQIDIVETQSSLALSDNSKGSQAFDNQFKTESYLLENSRATLIKERVREEAKKQVKTVHTDKVFFDEKVPEIIKKTDPKDWDKFQDGKAFDGKFLDKFVNDLVKSIGVALGSFGKFFEDIFKVKNFDPKTAGVKPKEDQVYSGGKAPRESISNVTDAKLVETARTFVGSTNFRGPEVAGGNLACAQVASTILKAAGVIDRTNNGVEGVQAELVKKGWKSSPGPASAGDVIIWGRTPTTMVDGMARPGHGHIGIMSSSEYSVNNNSAQKMPVESKVDLNSPRGVSFMKPPHRSA